MTIENSILKYALQNAIKFKGKANPGALVGKILGEDPSLKSQMRELGPKINKIVGEVNAMNLENQTAKLQEIAPELLEKKVVEKKGLKELEGAEDGKVIMRFAPSPSGPMHIGHAATGSLSSLYAEKYKGKFYLRIEDTNSSNIYVPAYEMIPSEADWLFGNVEEVIIQSSRIKVYYDYAENLLDMGKIYVCTCSAEKFKEFSDNKKDCPCRSKSKEENIKDWYRMHGKDNSGNVVKDKFIEGEAVGRFKTDMQHKNPAMRDFPIFRINDAEHPKTGKDYRVWPLMNLSVAVDDMEYGMTHIIRAKEHADNAKKQEFIFEAFNKPIPHTYFLGRFKFTDLEISASKTKARIEAGEFDGWDDIRLPFLEALRRRGFSSHCFKKLSTEIGLSSVDKVFTKEEYFKTLAAFNKETIESSSNRFFMIKDPVEIEVTGSEALNGKKVELDLHPDNKKGGRHFNINSKFLIEQDDFEIIKDGEVVRLIDCVNIKKHGDKFEYVSESYDEFKQVGKKIIHWLPNDKSQLVDVEILMPDKKLIIAVAEKASENIKVDDVVQFERFGFCRLDLDDGIKRFWFGHK